MIFSLRFAISCGITFTEVCKTNEKIIKKRPFQNKYYPKVVKVVLTLE